MANIEKFNHRLKALRQLYGEGVRAPYTGHTVISLRPGEAPPLGGTPRELADIHNGNGMNFTGFDVLLSEPLDTGPI